MRRFRIKQGVTPYPGKVVEARLVDERQIQGHVHVSASKIAPAERIYRRDEVDEIEPEADDPPSPGMR